MRRKVTELSCADYFPAGSIAASGQVATAGKLSEKFEELIDLEDRAGYELESWQVSVSSTEEVVFRTLIAVFKERPR